MPIPGAINGASDPEVPGDGGAGKKLAELQSLLVGDERQRLDRIEQQLHDPERRARDVGEVLAEAIELRTARDTRLRRSLEPIFERSFRASVRRNPDVLAETLYPVIGAAIRKAVNAALTGMIETLNQTLENRLSVRSMRWRLEALRTGKTYGEIMLLHSVRYAVEQVFLIHRATGLLLAHVATPAAVVKDADLVSGMLTAVQDFVRDSFGANSVDGLEQMQVGELTVWMQQGPLAILAGVIHGVPPAELKVVFQGALESIHQTFISELQVFQGDTAPFRSAEPTLRACLLGRSTPSHKPRRSRALALAAALLCGGGLVWAFFALREERRTNQYLDILRKEPGITVTGAEWQNGRFTVYGLRDPLSRDPVALSRGAGLLPAQLALHFEPYQSLNPTFSALRKLDADRASVESTLLRFETGSAVLTGPLLDRIEEMVHHLKALFQDAAETGKSARVEVTGHTDSTGTDDVNAVLAVDRAAAVAAEMRNLGIADSQFLQRGVGDKQPLRTGPGEWDQSFNRSVSFRIVMGEH